MLVVVLPTEMLPGWTLDTGLVIGLMLTDHRPKRPGERRERFG